MQISQFDFKNMSSLVNRVKDLWTPPNAEENFRCIYAEAVIRQDMHDNNLQFQITENDKLMAVACASKKEEENSAKIWWNKKYSKLTSEQQYSFNLSRDYLNMMDKRTWQFMNDDDVKLDLFISTKQGWGKKVLDAALCSFKQQGYKNMFLWTDSDCNVDWYISHGYELVEQGIYEPFSTEKEQYKTFIFKKTIL